MEKIVIFGGAFNPPHIGHAKAIELVLDNFSADEIWVMPSADRRDKVVGTDGMHRVEMLRAMVRELFPLPKIPVSVSDLEIKRPGLTTTYATKQELETYYPDSEFCFVVGADSAATIKNTWVNGKELFETGKFIILERPGFEMPEELPPHSTVIPRDISARDISSTKIREIIAAGGKADAFLAKSVAEYIRKNKLYR